MNTVDGDNMARRGTESWGNSPPTTLKTETNIQRFYGMVYIVMVP